MEYLKRDIYQRLLEWKPEQSGKVLEVEGARQSGKTFILSKFARDFKADVIVTGSYLGKVLQKEYFLLAGDLDMMTLETLSFEEFLEAAGKRDLYEKLDLYGKSSQEEYEEIRNLYQIYCQIGGYPAVVKRYFSTGSIQKAQEEIAAIVRIFIQESERYFDDILEMNLLGQLLPTVSQTMLKEKKGSPDLIKELSFIMFQEESNRITRKNINQAIAWFYRSHMVGYCGRVNEGNMLDVTPNCRFYFQDLGVASYFLDMAGARQDDMAGVVNENFVYLYLKRQADRRLIAGNAPMFASYKGGELDFFVNSRRDFQNYAVEVKAGKNAGKTAVQLLQDKKVSYVCYFKGDTYGGICGNVVTVPIYLAGRVVFDFQD